MAPRSRERSNPITTVLKGWLRNGNPVTMGLLLYIAMFQWTAYHQWYDNTSHAPNGSRFMEDPTCPKCSDSTFFSFSRFGGGSIVRAKTLYSHLKNDTVIQPIKPWIRQSEEQLKVPLPVFMTSLSKSGTTSLFKFFKCGGLKASHQYVVRPGETKSSLTGECMEQNFLKDAPPFQGCGEYDIFTDTGYLKYDHDSGERCFYPSVDALDRIYAYYPNATFINIVRQTDAWYQSLRDWSKASLFVRMRLCNGTHFPNGQTDKQGWYGFYDWHNEMVRQFVRDHPSITYIEGQLEDENLGSVLAEKLGIEADCWKRCRPQFRQCDEDMKDIDAGEKSHDKRALVEEARMAVRAKRIRSK